LLNFHIVRFQTGNKKKRKKLRFVQPTVNNPSPLANLVFEVVDESELREKGKNVLDFEDRALFQKLHGLLDVALSRHDVLGNAQPKTLFHRIVIFGLACIHLERRALQKQKPVKKSTHLGQLQIESQRQFYGFFKQSHQPVNQNCICVTKKLTKTTNKIYLVLVTFDAVNTIAVHISNRNECWAQK
jgi:hypothetical protein